ncbi:ribosomal protein S18-alanine N-acetyltransferase [Caenimonas aquaedulcis]|uniref:[Ribosomal protein bS18]-alanine N-acetyltransferase n=1 Tax=Caenimonas aquaedulcis TaxID=2793270 RepID=A0A931MHJ8_9BURK|nr:ribosomal protein S18-alanine N-acetyltransferase [Caenimonas aquaedulcis]MBG9388819.1 ribosomal protein S18-alanine N-acetyltransferase [Caenimonas aquaedulcis]
MSAVFKSAEAAFLPLTESRLDEVVAIERAAYAHPWTRGNFSDSLRSGYQAQLLGAQDVVLGYFVAMKGVDEVHLLNITVAPEHQGQGWGRLMLDALAIWSRAQGAQWLWLEVRAGNLRAQHIYERHGYRRVGERKGYYPGTSGQREDAVVMSLKL